MASIEVDDAQVLNALRQLADHVGNLRPAFIQMGEKLKESTQKRFNNYTGPDGIMWLANSDVTYDRKADRSGIPLTDSGTLGNTIDYNATNDELKLGSNMKYAAMMQFGGTKSEFPWLWGDIPARPFLGVSSEDNDDIIQIIRDFLSP